MKNPKEFMATPHDYKKVIDHSGPAKELVHNATRKEMATPYNHKEPIGHSGHDGMGNLMRSGKSNSADHMSAPSPSHFAPTPHSMPGVPAEPKKWNKKGYNMSVPSTMAEGAKIAAKMKKT